jgi:mannose-6-phosphate isomerase
MIVKLNLNALKFAPIFKYRMWGGEKLKFVLNKDYTETSIGESWELSQVPGDVSVVAEGHLKGKSLTELIQNFKGQLVGNKVYKEFGEEFPLLIKYIDAKTPLSIQVHPDNETARARHGSFGKNEMWYVMQADMEAELIVGWDKAINKQSYVQVLEKEDGSILDYMHHEDVQAGDTFYIPTGRVHAIGAGVMLAEIQQTSDVTYRVYDYDRVDAKTGEKRELHVEQSVDVMDFSIESAYKTKYELQRNKASKLVHSPYFKTNIIELEDKMHLDYSSLDSFVIYMAVEGSCQIQIDGLTTDLNYGETVLIPAEVSELEISGRGKLLEVSL